MKCRETELPVTRQLSLERNVLEEIFGKKQEALDPLHDPALPVFHLSMTICQSVTGISDRPDKKNAYFAD